MNVNSDGVAINGYDTVAYHRMEEAIPGSEEYSTDWNGATWWFSRAEHLELFTQNPEAYAPRYNGHCANGISDGHKVPGNPEIYRIIDGDLYLFFSQWGRLQWQFNQTEQIELADRKWLRFQRELGYLRE
ncbi:YHS domain-containing (seleno)protein [Saccharospirillum salsuginis]|uniref:YHS domain-containing (seleno)protein n=1 Tax=Saccharospirillum salsuginis TaxID=418750 RepID=UPI00167ABE77|nr:YHS domain-containing (seleno)protein [Saccharospirillum salsuginis]